MKYRYNATGTDIIPNKKFWIMLPGLIKVYYILWSGFDVSPRVATLGLTDDTFVVVSFIILQDGCFFTFGPVIGFFRAKISQGKGYEPPNS